MCIDSKTIQAKTNEEEIKIAENSLISSSKATKEEKGDLASKGYIVIPTNKGTDSLAFINRRDMQLSLFSDEITIAKEKVEIVLKEVEDLKNGLGIGSHKLLSVISYYFDENTPTAFIKLPLREYANLCGKDISTENKIKDFRRKINKDLTILYNLNFSFSEKTKQGLTDYVDMRLIISKGIKNGYICVKLHPDYANLLKYSTIYTQYPLELLKIDEGDKNAYKILYKMSRHFNNDTNIKAETNNRLKIKTLLKVANFKTIQEIREKQLSWRHHIKNYFDKTIERLFNKGLLHDYHYEKDGADIDEKEEMNEWSFEEWENTLLFFELKNPVDHSPRIQRKTERKKKTIKRASTSKRKKEGASA